MLGDKYKVVLEFENAPTLIQEWTDTFAEPDPIFSTLETIDFLYTEGNYGCDCNRSILLQEQYPDFPEMTCGSTLKMKSITITPIQEAVTP